MDKEGEIKRQQGHNQRLKLSDNRENGLQLEADVGERIQKDDTKNSFYNLKKN